MAEEINKNQNNDVVVGFNSKASLVRCGKWHKHLLVLLLYPKHFNLMQLIA